MRFYLDGFPKTNTDVCKLRIDFDTMVLSAPVTYAANPTAASTYLHGAYIGDCNTDTLTVSNPGGAVPPTICGYNTGQHMWVPASDSCNQINIDIDTGSTGTTRKWQIKVTQYECNNLMMPKLDCLQYHTATTGIQPKRNSFGFNSMNPYTFSHRNYCQL